MRDHLKNRGFSAPFKNFEPYEFHRPKVGGVKEWHSERKNLDQECRVKSRDIYHS